LRPLENPIRAVPVTEAEGGGNLDLIRQASGSPHGAHYPMRLPRVRRMLRPTWYSLILGRYIYAFGVGVMTLPVSARL
jgi:hypothetical protein